MFNFSEYNRKKWIEIKSDPAKHSAYLLEKKKSDIKLRKDPKYLELKRRYQRDYMKKRRESIKLDPIRYAELLKSEPGMLN